MTTRPSAEPTRRRRRHRARGSSSSRSAGGAAEQLAIAVAEQFALSVDAVHTLAERSGGNPLFVRELVFAAQHGETLESLPETVESLLTTRIDTLDPADRMLLRYAAVVGPTFELDLLGEILEDEIPEAGHPERWAYLGEFVVPAEGEALAFRHDLVRATAYEGLSFRRRRDIHGRVGAALEERLGPRADEEAALLSLHFLEASDHPRAWRYAVLAADRAEAGFANVVAAELYDRALAAAAGLDDVDPAELVRVNESLGDVCERFAAYERAFAALEAARAAGGADSPILDARLLGKQAAVLELMGRYEDALETCARGLARLDEAGAEGAEAGSVRAAIELSAGGINYRRTNTDEAVRWLERAAADAEAAGDRSTLAHAYYLLDAALTDLGRQDGLAYLELARPIYEELGDLRGLGVVLSNLGIHAYYEGRWDESAAYYAESRAAKERSGDVIGGAIQVNNEGEIFSDQGHLEQATASFDVMLRACRAAGWPFGAGAALSNLGRAAARAGRFQEAHAHFDEALALFEELAAERFISETRARRAECFLFEGRHGEALALATEVREAARKSPVGGLEALLERVIGLAHVQARRPAEAPPPPRGEPPARPGAQGRVRGGAHAARDGGGRLGRRRRAARGERRDPRAPRRRPRAGGAAAVTRPGPQARHAGRLSVVATLGTPGGQGRVRPSGTPDDPAPHPPACVLPAGRVGGLRRAVRAHPEHDPVHGGVRRGPAEGDRCAGYRPGAGARRDGLSPDDAVEPGPDAARCGRGDASRPCPGRGGRAAGVPLRLRHGGHGGAAGCGRA